ncbi:alpha-L-fucosidase [Streptomyces sp. SAI-135]|uniref:alpha-L-fucosidase n=1 Tax=unclassified Streptomyces TaxID=2593676 RepID=UPI002474725D|nr:MULTISPECIES: alpha-L-fucosidase [unclassified Streptomyces]MDH6514124.1 alpha-L-fucosidase [Streptomyces sp. SAI-090]MDH6621796.1 alpha-L-fucosidase [Streptomyces sp. SAI-135]
MTDAMPPRRSVDALDEIRALTAVRPSARQVAWQSMEFYAFIHFGMNTMTDREWGLGGEDPALFDPSDLDVDQWMSVIAAAGMTGAIITAKHHDGFCLWPSKVTAHSVAASPWQEGKGDLVRLAADAARRHGLKFGIYLSPWDRTEASYGSGQAYDDFFVRQLEELLSGYGEIFSVWFDGANGEGPGGAYQEYDWERYYAVVRRLQPGAVISVCGPDVRWCGNEAGHTRPDEWSVVPAGLRDVERVVDRSQHADDGAFSRLVRSDEEDLGSREALTGHLDDLVWYPAEVNTSIRPGWFYHQNEDDSVRSADELFDLWCDAVGGNACLLLNVPPDPRGRVAAPDVAALTGLGERIRTFRNGVLDADIALSSGVPRTPGGEALADRTALTRLAGDAATPYVWRPEKADVMPTVSLTLHGPTEVGAVVIREDITRGQRLERVMVIGVSDGSERVLAEANSVGYQRILRFRPHIVDEVKVRLEASRGLPAIRTIAVVHADAARSRR